MSRKMILPLVLGLCSALVAATHAADDEPVYDLVVYGGTSGGIAAAIQARRMGKTAILVEPSQHVGGLTSGGLGATDIGNKAAIGGISREFYRRVRKHYDDPAAWKHEKPEQYRSGRQSEAAKDDAMWTFEPSVAERIFREMLAEAEVKVLLGERLDRSVVGTLRVPSAGNGTRSVPTTGVALDGKRITALKLVSGNAVRGRRFIDATYEGDLMAAAGVNHMIGREANRTYDETLSGVQTKNAIKHQFVPGVDPYVVKGDKTSGLLPGVHAGPPGVEGGFDTRVQAYNFRLCLTDVKENQIPFEKPAGYDELRYELLFRNFEAGETRIPWSPTLMPNRKTDVNNNHGFSTDNIGMNYDWPFDDDAEREKIFQEHLQYTQGLLWTLANHPRVPAYVRQEVSRWGLCKDEFQATGGWPHQLYVREARRMIGAYVMTQHNCQGKVVAEDSVGLAAYTMDSHNVQRYVDAQGQVRNEGDVQVGGFPPYPIAYRSLTPKKQECENLLVPICLSASHIAYGSIRMEPVFMVLGQSAAIAAVQSLDGDAAVQDIDVGKLQERLKADGQILAWTGPKVAGGIDPKKLPGIIIDDPEAEKAGEWSKSSSIAGFLGQGYLHDNNEQKGKLAVTFRVPLPKPGKYEVRLAYTANPNRATDVPITVYARGGESVKQNINQRKAPPIDGTFISLGTFEFDKEAVVVVRNDDTDGHVIADGVQLIPARR
ncbi:MAG TPA: FAD-dependent oxidoreductase [Pirellulaceae bacterium]|nr:FAD-dependent oxidoreductase [Pirellulaceae bacterium]